MAIRSFCASRSQSVLAWRLVTIGFCSIIALAIILVSESVKSQSPPTVNVNILSRVFRIRLHGSHKAGTAFTIDVDSRQYLVTAKHVIPDATLNDSIDIFHENQWKSLPVQVFFSAVDSTDIALIVPPIQLSPTFPAPPSSDKMMLGQDCYFIGFPYGLYTDEQGAMSGFPLPLIRKGTLSAMIRHSGWMSIVVDGNANPGNSGGPLVFWQADSKMYQICGVMRRVYLLKDTAMAKIGDDSVPIFFRKAAGLAEATEIGSVLDLIKAHPIGVKISKAEEK